MDTLEQARAEIDAVDAQLAALFERRMAAVLSVAQYKQAHGLPIFDAAREAAVLEKAAARIQKLLAGRRSCCRSSTDWSTCMESSESMDQRSRCCAKSAFSSLPCGW